MLTGGATALQLAASWAEAPDEAKAALAELAAKVAEALTRATKVPDSIRAAIPCISPASPPFISPASPPSSPLHLPTKVPDSLPGAIRAT